MKLQNNSENHLMHGIGDDAIVLKVGETKEVSEGIAKVWLKINGVVEYVSPADLEAEKKKAVEEALKAERAKVAKEQKAKEKAETKTKTKKEEK